MMNDLTSEPGRRKRAAWGAFKSIEDVVKKTKNIRLRAHIFYTIVLERGVERVMLGATRFTRVNEGIRSPLPCHRSKIRDAAAYAKEGKIRDATGQHLRAIATNGSITGARYSKSMKNGSTGDTVAGM
ncbi:hypothetical protein RB195_025234 [Necator americanus]|uniref:Uncharacterized protein n=1 Tax=Necator americanus TaxID=51031 RepID=A0ABR1ERF5_NECAM